MKEIDRGRLRAALAQEQDRFVAERPRSRELFEQAREVDPEAFAREGLEDWLTGSLSLQIIPWAQIDLVQRKSNGESISVDENQTPCVLPLPVGDYRIEVSNPLIQESLVLDLEVRKGQTCQVVERFEGFDLEEELSLALPD